MNTAILETEIPAALQDDAPQPLLSGPGLRDEDGAENALRERRGPPWQKFQSLAMPARTDEAWRFANLKAIDPAAFSAPQPVTAEEGQDLVERSLGLDSVAGRMVFANGQLLSREGHADELRQKGVLWLPLNQAATEYPELFRKHFMREEAALGSVKFAALHEAFVGVGTFLFIPKGVEIEQPIEAFHWLHGNGGSCFPHTLIIAEENSKVTFVDYFASSDPESSGFACGVNDLWLGAGAKVNYVNVQQWSLKTQAVQVNSTVVGRDASAIAMNANFGGGYVRGESISHLRASGGRSDMLSFALPDGSQTIDQRTLQIHEAPHAASDLLYKNALDGQSHTIFAGLIRVAPGAHFTDAYQKVRNLLLSDDAEANSAPGLEIEADNVRCTHGATSGQIEGDELFYLLSRGIPKAAAQRLIVFGFLNEVIERLPHEPTREKLRSLLRTCV